MTSTPPYSPYANAAANHIYNLLFCDDPASFADGAKESPGSPLAIALSGEAEAVRGVAEDATVEGRVRALAFNRLRALGQPVTPKILLGAIVEVPLDGGLDTLAVFADGGIRYLNQTSKMWIFETPLPQMKAAIAAFLAASQAVVNRIGPWDKPRLPPPPKGDVRLTFLVSDGLYFGQGKFADLSRDALGGPVIAHAGELLQQVAGAVSG